MFSNEITCIKDDLICQDNFYEEGCSISNKSFLVNQTDESKECNTESPNYSVTNEQTSTEPKYHAKKFSTETAD